MDDERGRPRVQSSVRLRRIGRRCNGCFGEEVENCATAVSLRGWFRARNSVSGTSIPLRFNLEGVCPSRRGGEEQPYSSFLVHESSRIVSKIEDAEHVYEITIGGRAKSVDRWPCSIFFLSLFLTEPSTFSLLPSSMYIDIAKISFLEEFELCVEAR